MNPIRLLVFCFFLPVSHLFSQECDCSSQLDYVIRYYEANNPAFQKLKSDPESHKQYLGEAEKLRKLARKEKDIDYCFRYMDRYVTLLKDHHSGMGYNLKRADLSTPEHIADFKRSPAYLAFPKIPIDTSTLIPNLVSKSTADIEGIYSDGRNTVFGIIPKKNSTGHYLGIVLRENKLLDPGHILMELSRVEGNTYEITYNVGLLGFNLNRIFKTQVIENGQIPALGFSKQVSITKHEKPYAFSVLNDSTNYIRLSDFDAGLTAALDSFYTTLEPELGARPFLVIDVRGNGGGSEGSYLGLLPYAYTRPLKIDSATVWVSPDNIRQYESASSINNKKLIDRMKAATPFSFIPYSEDPIDTWTLDSITTYPRRIALLHDRGTASSAEGMILYFLQSDKVITIGENSGGYIGFGNVMTAQTPCGHFTIQSTTTQYFEKSKYEFTGIPPMYPVSKSVDWVTYAAGLLGK